jgi:hypothetical protein
MEHGAPLGVQPEHEFGDYAKVSTSTAHRPEQIRVFSLGGTDHLATGSDNCSLDYIVNDESMLAGKPSATTAQS